MVIAGQMQGGGGHHHGHGHHGGGHGRRHGYYQRGGYGPYFYPPPEVLVVETRPACPDTWAPVLGADGRIYRNACVAQKHGVGVKRAATGGEVKTGPVLGATEGSILPFLGLATLWAVGVAVLARRAG